MPDDKIIQLPDGRVVSFPQEMSDDAIAGAIRFSLSPAAAAGATDPNIKAKQVLQNIPQPQQSPSEQVFSPQAGPGPGAMGGHFLPTYQSAEEAKGGAKQASIGLATAGAGSLASGSSLLTRILAMGGAAGGGDVAGSLAGGDKPSPVEAMGTAALGMAGEGVAGGVADMLKNFIKSSGLQAAGTGLERVKSLIGQAPVDTTKTMDMATQVEAFKQLTRQRMPTVMQGFLTRARNLEKGPMTFDQARDLYKTAGGLAWAERSNLSPEMLNNLKNFQISLGQDIQNAAENAGLGKTFAGNMHAYHLGKVGEESGQTSKEMMMEILKKIATKTGEAAATGAGAGAAYKLLK